MALEVEVEGEGDEMLDQGGEETFGYLLLGRTVIVAEHDAMLAYLAHSPVIGMLWSVRMTTSCLSCYSRVYSFDWHTAPC
jgi:hypothetical protein